MVIAKRYDAKLQSLKEHTAWVVEEAQSVLVPQGLDRVSRLVGWKKERIEELLFFALYFHDIGKATKEFQRTISEGTRSYHSLYSASAVCRLREFVVEDEAPIDLLLLLVLSHHTLLPYTPMTTKWEFLKEAKDFFVEYLEAYERFFHKKCPYEWSFEPCEEVYEEVELVQSDLEQYFSDYKRLWIFYGYCAGVLGLSDWLASMRFEGRRPVVNFEKEPDPKELQESFPFELRPFQKELADTKGSVLVQIPTGEGKTEGSLLWAFNNMKTTGSKLIYTMPTQTTSNKLYDRFGAIFGRDFCGLIHANAKNYLEKSLEREDGIVDDGFGSEYLLSRHFCKPVSVSTIDALLKHFINVGRYPVVMKNFFESAVVIDEIHSYDFRLLGFVKRFLELCEEFGVPVCVMSATLPSKIKELLGIDRYPVVTQPDLYEKKGVRIRKKEYLLQDDLERIVEAYRNGKKVLVVRNLIKEAKKTFLDLKKLGVDVMLYHSEFKKIDRAKKENEIFERLERDKPFVLVATQVVEISLDIDFDVLFSDLAPIDALVQRFGRVNRKKDPTKIADAYIYRVKSDRPYGNNFLLELSFEALEEGEVEIGRYNDWVERVYERLFEQDVRIQNEVQSRFDEGYRLFDRKLEENRGIFQLSKEYTLRDIDYPKFDYLLYEDYMEGKTGYEHTIALPKYYEKEHLYHPQQEMPFKVLDLPYSYEEGIQTDVNEDQMIW
jgi:CRISPR-associated endonuclease/helicase Cas3